MEIEFNKGDKVTVYFVEDGAQVTGTLQHIPNNVGDSWHIIDEKGNLQAINPNCSNFERIVKFVE